MNIKPNSNLLSSLTSLINPQQREHSGNLTSAEALKRTEDKALLTEKITQNTDRQSYIDANRTALKNLQDRLKSDNLEKLKTKFSEEDGGRKAQNRDVNLNHRENLRDSNKPVNTRPGQIIDIRV